MPDERGPVRTVLSAHPNQVPDVGTAEGVGPRREELVVTHVVSVAHSCRGARASETIDSNLGTVLPWQERVCKKQLTMSRISPPRARRRVGLPATNLQHRPPPFP